MDFDDWEGLVRTNHRLIWFVSPQLARQVMSMALLNWQEHLSTHEHVFIIPRLLQRSFDRVNKNMIYLGAFKNFPQGHFRTDPSLHLPPPHVPQDSILGRRIGRSFPFPSPPVGACPN